MFRLSNLFGRRNRKATVATQKRLFLEQLEDRRVMTVDIADYGGAGDYDEVSGSSHFVVAISGPPVNYPLTVNYELVLNGATIRGQGTDDRADFELVGTYGTVTIPANVGAANVTLNIINDEDPEPDESITFYILPGDGYTVISSNGTTKTILKNDQPAPPREYYPGCTTCSTAGNDRVANQGVAGVSRSYSPTGFSSNPVRYSDGTVLVSATDIESGGFGVPWGITRQWTNGPGYWTQNIVGNGMVVNERPTLLSIDGTDELAVVTNGYTAYYFDWEDTAYEARGFFQHTLEEDAGDYVLTTTDGTQIRFFGLDSSIVAGKRGQLKSYTDSFGNELNVISHNAEGLPTEIERSYTSGEDTITESLTYAYVPSGVHRGYLQAAALRRKINSGDWTVVRIVEYAYYEDDEDHGNFADLKLVTIKDGSDNTLDMTYYRYYKPEEEGGYAHALKYVVYPQSMLRLIEAEGSDLDEIEDEDLAPFADHYFEYDNQHRVTLEIAQGDGCSSCNGGQGEFAFSYTTSGNGDGYNIWKTKTVETLPDGNQNIVYSNYLGQVMLEIYKDTTTNDQWATFYRYDEAGRVLFSAQPSAISGYNDTYADLLRLQTDNFQYLRDDEGLITVYSYYDTSTAGSSTPGGVVGYLDTVSVRQGEFGTDIPQQTTEYISRTAGSTIYLPATQTVYTDEAGLEGLTTTFAYTFFTGTTQIESQTTTDPSSAVTEVFFDAFGRPIWVLDAGGFIHYTEYDQQTGAVVKIIADVDTDEDDFTGLPYGWVNETGSHSITTYEVDGLGRPTKETDANGNITYIVYKDLDDEIRIYPGWDNDAPTGPIVVMRHDDAGGYSEVLTMSATPTVSDGRPTGAEAISNLQSLTRSYVNAAGQVIHEDAYFSFNALSYTTSSMGTEGTHFYRTELAYDQRGRQAKTVRADGTIYRTVFDGLGRPVSEWIGDDDDPEEGFWSPSNPAEMVKIRDYEYDNDNVGDSRLTSVIDALGRETTLAYDFRGRVTSTTLPDPDDGGPLASPVYLTTYDNLGRTLTQTDPLGNVTVYAYDDAERKVTITLPDPDGPGPATAPQTITVRDALGRVVMQTDLLGHVTTNEYDGQGRLIKVILPDPDDVGGPLDSPEIEYEYDAGGRLRFVTDALENVTEYVYDKANRLVQVISEDPDDGGGLVALVTTYTYTAAGLLSTVTTPGNRTTTYHYDALGRRIKVVAPDPDGGGGQPAAETEYEYDAANRLITVIDAYDKETTYEHDLFDNVITITAPDPDGPPDGFGGGLQNSPVTTFDYDNAGQLLEMIDPLGRVTNYEYDALGRQKKVIHPDPDGEGGDPRPETVFIYDAAGNLTQQINPLGNRIVYEYDNLYRKVAEKQASGDLPTAGVVTSTQGGTINEVQEVGFTDIFQLFGGTFTLTFNSQTTGAIAWDASASTVQAALEALSNLDPGDVLVTKIVDTSASQKWRLEFQGSLAGSNVPQTTVDASSVFGMSMTETESTDPQGSTANEVQTVTLSDGTGGTFRLQFGNERTTAIAYNASAGTVETALEALTNIDNVSVSGSAGGPWTITFQGAQAGQNVPTLVPEATYLTNTDLLTTTRFTYDANGRMLSLTDPVGNVTAWEYDNLGRMIEETNQLTAVRTFAYDAVGNLIQRIDRLGRKIEYVYDNVYRNTSEKWYDGVTLVRTLSFAYSAAGDLISASDPVASYSYSYDGLGRVTSEGQSITGLTPTLTYGSEYDLLSRRIELLAEIDSDEDFLNTYTYDNLSRLTRIQQDSGADNVVAEKRIDFAYDASSAFTKISRYADLTGSTFVAASHYVYDGIGRLQKLTHNESNTPAGGWGTNPLAGYQYVYDAASRIESINSYIDGLTEYTHDDTNQLTAADHTGMGDESYTYDENGNRTGGYTPDTNNQMASDGTYNYTYDEEGNRLTRTKISNDYVTRYEWDHRNRLVSVTEEDDNENVLSTVEHSYDVFNRWVRRSVDEDGPGGDPAVDTFFSHENGQIALQFDGDLSHRYLWGPQVDQLLADETVSSYVAAGDVIWALADHLGTIRDLAEYDSGTSVVNHRRYDSFGKFIDETDPVDLLFGFTGRAFDETTGLQNNWNRWYDPTTGQWLSEDPIGFGGLDTNLSRLVGNSPLTYTDSDGLAATQSTSYSYQAVFGEGTLTYHWSATEVLSVFRQGQGDVSPTGKMTLGSTLGVDITFRQFDASKTYMMIQFARNTGVRRGSTVRQWIPQGPKPQKPKPKEESEEKWKLDEMTTDEGWSVDHLPGHTDSVYYELQKTEGDKTILTDRPGIYLSIGTPRWNDERFEFETYVVRIGCDGDDSFEFVAGFSWGFDAVTEYVRGHGTVGVLSHHPVRSLSGFSPDALGAIALFNKSHETNYRVCK